MVYQYVLDSVDTQPNNTEAMHIVKCLVEVRSYYLPMFWRQPYPDAAKKAC